MEQEKYNIRAQTAKEIRAQTQEAQQQQGRGKAAAAAAANSGILA
jgi:hypothetical protein